ncbi:MAG: GxGYxYP family putative glycoside hydrolase [Acidobacteriota bacterium]|nr:GxGYxYP family putative glycoside hydrolase [Acidobacteriota bacterium]
MRLLISTLIPLFLLSGATSGAVPADFNGTWELVPQASSVIPLYRTLAVEIRIQGGSLTLTQKWGTRARDAFTDTIRLPLDGSTTPAPLQHQVAPTTVFLGVRNMPRGQREMSASLDNGGTVLTVREKLAVETSQGASRIEATHAYALSAPGQIMTYTVTRAARKSGGALSYTLKRAGTRRAYFMRLEDDWAIGGKLAQQAFLISLQGLANGGGPSLYFIYPEKWDFRYTPGFLDFLQNERFYSFQELRTPAQALDAFRDRVSGYVVWDKAVRTSLIVAFTVAGLERAIVVSEELIPLAERAGLKPVADFRGRFTEWSDIEIYRWAKQQYWHRCSREYIVWLGGEHGDIMKPGVADWGIHKKVFFNDLCANESIPEEYRLTRELLAEMKPFGFVFGWHSYKKDLEEEWVRLTSSYALRVEGLHSLPNMSFSSQVPATPGFVFKNNHRLEPGKPYPPGKKVYIACIQTDGIGLGAWNQPGRGEIPYAWEVSMNYSWLAPAMLEYFYSQATPNDFFIGCLGGPGYVYPKAVPPRHLPRMVDLAYGLMKKLDLNVFEIMDYSEGVMVEGNSDLTREVVDSFYRGMPDAIGFANGYVQSHTFSVRDKRPLVSYDYYMAPECSEEQAAADLEELAELNTVRPYYLLMHVRQYSNVRRVKSILNRLGPDFETVPLDIFLKMAGEHPTFVEKYRR